MGRPKGTKNTVLHKWSDEEKEYLSEITPGRHYKEIHKMMNDKFEYQFTYKQVTAAIKRYNLKTGFNGRFEKGHIPANKGTKGIMKANKTSFKKGNASWNKKPIGSERINIEGYTEIKVAEPNKWRLKHRVMYEKYHNVVLNPKQLVIFADRDKSNMSKENLLLLDNNQLLVLNHNKLINENAELKKLGMKAGVPDLLLLAPKGKYIGLAIEMKYGKNKCTIEQVKWLDWLYKQGYMCKVCWSSEEAIAAIKEYLGIK